MLIVSVHSFDKNQLHSGYTYLRWNISRRLENNIFEKSIALLKNAIYIVTLKKKFVQILRVPNKNSGVEEDMALSYGNILSDPRYIVIFKINNTNRRRKKERIKFDHMIKKGKRLERTRYWKTWA